MKANSFKLTSFENGERTRLACRVPRPRGTHGWRRTVHRLRTRLRAGPTSEGAGRFNTVVPGVAFVRDQRHSHFHHRANPDREQFLPSAQTVKGMRMRIDKKMGTRKYERRPIFLSPFSCLASLSPSSGLIDSARRIPRSRARPIFASSPNTKRGLPCRRATPSFSSKWRT